MMLDERLVSVPVVRSAVGPAVALAGFDSEEEARNVAGYAQKRAAPISTGRPVPRSPLTTQRRGLSAHA
jgi:hypothetical protein